MYATHSIAHRPSSGLACESFASKYSSAIGRFSFYVGNGHARHRSAVVALKVVRGRPEPRRGHPRLEPHVANRTKQAARATLLRMRMVAVQPPVRLRALAA